VCTECVPNVYRMCTKCFDLQRELEAGRQRLAAFECSLHAYNLDLGTPLHRKADERAHPHTPHTHTTARDGRLWDVSGDVSGRTSPTHTPDSVGNNPKQGALGALPAAEAPSSNAHQLDAHELDTNELDASLEQALRARHIFSPSKVQVIVALNSKDASTLTFEN